MQTQIGEGTLTHIGETITIGNSTRTQQQNSTESPKVYGLSKQAPYVKPVLWPDEIIKDTFTYEERENFIRIIATKQKTHADWETIRLKLPEDFLRKIKTILEMCWKNGFCNPHISEGSLKWSQIKGNDFKYPEQCDLCRNSFSSGLCKGIGKYSANRNNEFKKCWEGV